MNADAGDWLVIKSGTIGRPDLRGLITSVRSPDGEPPYRVRWLATGEEATVFPGPDAIVVTAAEQQTADERARSRFAAVQAAIRHRAGAGSAAKYLLPQAVPIIDPLRH